MSEDRNGFEIDGEFYEYTERTPLMAATLIREVTGLMYAEFEQRRVAMFEEGHTLDPEILCGMIAIAVSRKHRDWSRAKVVKFMEDHDWEDVEAFGEEDEEADATDPTLGVESLSTTGTESTPPSVSNGGQADPSEAANQRTTGTRESVTGSPV